MIALSPAADRLLRLRCRPVGLGRSGVGVLPDAGADRQIQGVRPTGRPPLAVGVLLSSISRFKGAGRQTDNGVGSVSVWQADTGLAVCLSVCLGVAA